LGRSKGRDRIGTRCGRPNSRASDRRAKSGQPPPCSTRIRSTCRGRRSWRPATITRHSSSTVRCALKPPGPGFAWFSSRTCVSQSRSSSSMARRRPGPTCSKRSRRDPPRRTAGAARPRPGSTRRLWRPRAGRSARRCRGPAGTRARARSARRGRLAANRGRRRDPCAPPSLYPASDSMLSSSRFT
jgi:hypothetical protein